MKCNSTTQDFKVLSDHPVKYLQLRLLTNYTKTGSALMGDGRYYENYENHFREAVTPTRSHWLRTDE